MKQLTIKNMTTNFNQKDLEMINDLIQYAKAINFEIKNEDDLKELLKKWVNHRVELTTEILNKSFDDYLEEKGFK